MVRYETFEPIHKLIGPPLFHVDVRICAFIVEINYAGLFSASSPMDELRGNVQILARADRCAFCIVRPADEQDTLCGDDVLVVDVPVRREAMTFGNAEKRVVFFFLRVAAEIVDLARIGMWRFRVAGRPLYV